MKSASLCNASLVEINETGLRIEFHQRPASYDKLDEPSHSEALQSLESSPSPHADPAKPAAVADEKELLEDARVTQLMFEDPVAFEQEMIDGQLNGRRTSLDDGVENR